MSARPLVGEPHAQTLDKMRVGAFHCFEAGRYADALHVINGMAAVSPIGADLWLLKAVCSAALGDSSTAAAIIDTVERAVGRQTEASADFAELLTSARSWLPGGANSAETRAALKFDASRWLPKLVREVQE